MTWTLNARLYKEWTEEFDEDETLFSDTLPVLHLFFIFFYIFF